MSVFFAERHVFRSIPSQCKTRAITSNERFGQRDGAWYLQDAAVTLSGLGGWLSSRPLFFSEVTFVFVTINKHINRNQYI